MIKLLSITMIIVTSVLVLGAIGLGSFVSGQPNISSYQTTNQSNTMGAGGGGSCADSNNSSYQTTNQSNTMGAGGGGGGSSVDSKNNCGALIIFR